ncbi:amidohydrolase [Patescibacteria group bacterium]|nr:amidohydrolase [Patescibacteria group bacterium]
MKIPVEEYLAYALLLKPEEKKLREDLLAWMPERIIDCHMHCNLSDHVAYINKNAQGHMLSTFPYYSIEDSARNHWLLYGEKKVRRLRMPKTFRGLQHRVANEYLLRHSPVGDKIAVFGLPEDISYTNELMRHPRCAALKMYWSYIDPPAQKIYDFFLPEILEEAQALDVPIILHLPKMIVRSVDDLLQMLSDFPKLRVVLAHLGLSKMLLPGLAEAFSLVRENDNVVLDTALNPSGDVMSLAMSLFGVSRIMFGSDEPLQLIRSVAYQHPEKGERIVTDYPYHWVDSDDQKRFGHLASSVVHAHWQSFAAIKDAVSYLAQHTQKAAKQKIFHDNAEAFFGF